MELAELLTSGGLEFAEPEGVEFDERRRRRARRRRMPRRGRGGRFVRGR